MLLSTTGSRRAVTGWTMILLAFAVAGAGAQDADLDARARAIHDRVLVLDTHNDIEPANFTRERNYTQRLATQVNLPKMVEGGLDASFFIVYVEQQGDFTPAGYGTARAAAIEKFTAIHRLTREIAPDAIELALTAADVRRIYRSGKKVALIGVENGYPLGEDLGAIQEFHALGARYLSLAHNGHNQFSDSHTGERDGRWHHRGLSELGRRAVTELNRVGIMIDVSHPSKESMLQTVALSKAPVIASHSAVRALADHSRNMDDEQLRALARNGGVIQLVAFTGFVKVRDSTDRRPLTVADFVDHVDYAVKLIGIDHVGISSDFDGGGGLEDWRDASQTFNVTRELVRRGYTEEQITKLWGENLLRVLERVEQVARSTRAGR